MHINILNDFVSFAIIVMVLARLSLTQFSVLSFLNFPSKVILPKSLENTTITVHDIHHQEHKLTMTEVISCQLGIIGLCSFVCGVKYNTLGDKLALKFSYQDISHTNEYELI